MKWLENYSIIVADREKAARNWTAQLQGVAVSLLSAKRASVAVPGFQASTVIVNTAHGWLLWAFIPVMK